MWKAFVIRHLLPLKTESLPYILFREYGRLSAFICKFQTKLEPNYLFTPNLESTFEL